MERQFVWPHALEDEAGKLVDYTDSRNERGWHMLYPYLTLEDGTEVVHSELLEAPGAGRVIVHFERATEAGFDSIRFELPSYACETWEGRFSDGEIDSFRDFLAANAHLIYRYAAQGGLKVA